jgi:hypothetical protein
LVLPTVTLVQVPVQPVEIVTVVREATLKLLVGWPGQLRVTVLAVEPPL